MIFHKLKLEIQIHLTKIKIEILDQPIYKCKTKKFKNTIT